MIHYHSIKSCDNEDDDHNDYNDEYDGDGGEWDGDDIGRPGGNDYTGPSDDDGG